MVDTAASTKRNLALTPVAADSEQETRDRLLTAAAQLFAAHGFAKVTVRDICRAADANGAAVNYHFHGKQGLYDAVIQTAIRRMQGTTETIAAAGRGRSPEEQLTAYISIFLQRVVQMRDSWIHQLLVRELADPTPALNLVVSEVLEPRMTYLATVIADLLRCRTTDPRVRRAVMSVQWQCLAAIDTRLPSQTMRPVTAGSVAEVADHIARFSLGGIRALTRSPRSRPAKRRETRRARRAPLPLRPSRQ